MKAPSHARVSYVLTTAMIVLFAAAVVSLYFVDRMRANVRQQDVMYIPSAKVVRRMSLGYTGLAADIYWTRAVQYFGLKHKNRSEEYNLLYPFLDIATQLDPHLLVAYRFGATFLAQRPPEGAGDPDKAVALVERGIKNNPNDWHLYYDLGFLHAMERHDYLAAAEAFRQGSLVPKAHPFLKVLAATMAQHGGDLNTARLLWQTTLTTTDDPNIKQNAERHLRALEVDETVPKLQQIVKLYTERTGAKPTNFMELVSAGYLRRIPVDPVGHAYKILSDGTVVVQDPDALPFITEGMPPGYKAKFNPVPGLSR